jgi:hypothetical protein
MRRSRYAKYSAVSQDVMRKELFFFLNVIVVKGSCKKTRTKNPPKKISGDDSFAAVAGTAEFSPGFGW